MTNPTQSNQTLSALIALQIQVDALIKAASAKSKPIPAVKPKTPHALLDTLAHEFRIKNDSAIARAIKKSRAEISQIRHGRELSHSIILAIHETFDMPVARIRQLAAA